MKKLLILLTVAMIVVLCACGKTETAENRISQLLEEGYTINSSSNDGDVWMGLFTNEEGKVFVVKAKMTADINKEFNALDISDEEFESKQQNLLKKLEVSDVYDISDQLPSKEDLQKYVGKTFGEIEAEGFENTGYIESDNGLFNFNYENDTYCMILKNSADTPIKDIDTLTDEQRKALVAGEVVDLYISGNIIDKY